MSSELQSSCRSCSVVAVVLPSPLHSFYSIIQVQIPDESLLSGYVVNIFLFGAKHDLDLGLFNDYILFVIYLSDACQDKGLISVINSFP